MESFDDEEDAGGGLDLKVLVLYGVLRSRGWIVLLTVLGTSVGLLIAAAQPNVYSSEARLQFTPGMAESLSNEDSLGYDDGIRTVPGIQDEIMLLTDPRVFEDVARRLGPSWVLELPDPAEGDGPSTSLPVRLMHGLQSWIVQQQRASRSEAIDDASPIALRAAAESLAARVKVRTGRRSQILVVTADAWSPEDAQRTLTVVVDEFVRRHNEHYGSNFERIEKDLETKREQLQVVQEGDRIHKDTCGIEDLLVEKETTLTQLLELRTRRRTLDAELIGLEASLAQLGPELEEMPDVVEVEEPGIVNPDIATLEAAIEAEQEYIRRITVKEPIRDPVEREQKVAAAEAEIVSLQQRLAEAPALVPGPTRLEANGDKAALATRLGELRLQVTTVNGELDQLDEEQERLLQRQDKARACNLVHERNTTRIVNLQDEIQKLEGRYRAALSIESYRADGESNLRRYTAPDLQPDKTGPERTKLLLAGLLGGAALGGGIALLRQLLERRVRYRETLEGALGIPVLAVVDESRALRKLRSGRAS